MPLQKPKGLHAACKQQYTAAKARNQGGRIPPRKIFAPLEKCVGHSLKILDIVQKISAPLGNHFVPPGAPSWLRACCSRWRSSRILGWYTRETEGGTRRLIHGNVSKCSFVWALLVCIHKIGAFKHPKAVRFKSFFFPVFTCGHESWVICERVLSEIQAIDMGFLRTRSHVTLCDKVCSSKIRRLVHGTLFLFYPTVACDCPIP